MVFFLASLVAALAPAGPAASHVSQGTRLFRDPAYQVSFRYPVDWKLADEEHFMFGLRIQNYPSPSSKGRLRALLYSMDIPGVRPWPETNFAGIEFGYDARPVGSSRACQAEAHNGFHPGKVETLTVHGIPFWHWTDGDGGMSQSVSEDIYATYVGSATGGSCLLFDLAVHESTAAGDNPARAYTPNERHLIYQSLTGVLSSVRISTPSR
jgi:hypothetical protein